VPPLLANVLFSRAGHLPTFILTGLRIEMAALLRYICHAVFAPLVAVC